jgi:hypothetical protein
VADGGYLGIYVYPESLRTERMSAFVKAMNALEPLWSALTASSEQRARRVARVSVGGTDALIACIPNFGDGTYHLCWWYGENVGSAPYQDVVAVGVVMDSKLLL